LILVGWIRIRIGNREYDPGGQKCPKKIEKREEIQVLKSWMFSFEG
jgi:hypothetical protein